MRRRSGSSHRLLLGSLAATVGLAVVLAGAGAAGAADTPKPAKAVAFEKAVADHRACAEAAVTADRDPSTCKRPDPAAYGVTVGTTPPQVEDFKRAVDAHRTCLTTRADKRSCGAAPEPDGFGLEATTEPAAITKLKDDVKKYKACTDKNGGKVATCGTRPDPAKLGFVKQ